MRVDSVKMKLSALNFKIQWKFITIVAFQHLIKRLLGKKNNKNPTFLTPEDLEQFIYLWVPRKQWSLVHHLSKYTSHRPHINRSRIVAWSKQYFRCSVPQGHHLGITTNVYEPRHNNDRWYQKAHQTNSSCDLWRYKKVQHIGHCSCHL